MINHIGLVINCTYSSISMFILSFPVVLTNFIIKGFNFFACV